MKKLIPNLMALIFSALACSAQWSSDPKVNTPVCVQPVYQTKPYSVSDGSGGAIIFWRDKRNNTAEAIYSQRLDAGGNPLWAANGVLICSTQSYEFLTATSDGNGGAIVAWEDGRSASTDIYAQKINASGAVQWTTDGVLICGAANDQRNPKIVSDGSGGAFITWGDLRVNGSASQEDVYAQRVNASGAIQWAADGIAIRAFNDLQTKPQIISDGSGGAIIAYEDSEPDNEIYIQRVDASGNLLWLSSGVPVVTKPNIQGGIKMVSDGAGGAILAWNDDRTAGGSGDVYCQRVNAAGVAQWAADGVLIATGTGIQKISSVSEDGNGGAYLVWDQVNLQLLNASGVKQWANDVVMSSGAYSQDHTVLISDGAGNIIAVWDEISNGSDRDIVAQKIDVTGALLWGATGTAVSNTTGGQTWSHGQIWPSVISDGSGGGIVAWQDSRNTGDLADIYATKIFPGTNGITRSSVSGNSLPALYPNPSKGIISFSLAEEMKAITILNSVGEIVYENGSPSRTIDITGFPKGLYIVRVTGSSGSHNLKLVLE